MKNHLLKFGLPVALVILIILVTIQFINFHNLSAKLEEIERKNLLYFSHEVQAPIILMDKGLDQELLRIVFNELATEYQQAITSFHSLSYENEMLFKDIEDYVESNPTEEKMQKLIDYLDIFEDDMKKFNRETKDITNENMNEFIKTKLKEFNEIKGE